MKLLKFLISLLLTLFVVQAFNSKLIELPILGAYISQTEARTLPPLAPFFDPFNGFWQNAEMPSPQIPESILQSEIKAPVKVVYDERMVPHIFAENETDLYFVQGYLTASQRLWQMEFQTLATEGRLSEVVGPKTLAIDRQQRRTGIVRATEKMMALIDEHPTAKKAVEAYTKGVNAYIDQLAPKKYPLEYKLIDYKPEAWTPFKCALLSKRMSISLSGYETDLEATNALKLLGKEDFDLIYPDFPKGIDPVVPIGADFTFEPVATRDKDEDVTQNALGTYPADMLYPKPDPSNGSNNWALAGEKTASGSTILCSDPHLRLSLPSIWHEVQLSTPEMNTYGVTIPGAPGIIIGFNEHISWGVTNSGRDVKDWYKITFRGEAKDEYQLDGEWRSVEKVIDTIKVRGQADIIDTILYTHHGPVVYEDATSAKNNMALRWTLHDPSNEFITFYKLNRAKNYEEYLAAIETYESPAQNFAYADRKGNIAIWHQGKLPLKNKEQGKFVQDGSLSENDWQGFIPQKHNPHSYNPERGFVSSANQHPTDETYPYYYNGRFQHYRNRRLNQQLTMLEKADVIDMQKLQLDNYNLLAAELMPSILTFLKEDTLTETELPLFKDLKKWNFYNDGNLTAPAVFEAFWQHLYENIWDEVLIKNPPLPEPKRYITAQFLTTKPSHKLMDIVGTPQKETAPDLIVLSFKQAVETLTEWAVKHPGQKWTWSNFQGTDIHHMIDRLSAFGALNLKTSGGRHILNATSQHHGPSWRMIVEMDSTIKAWGIYPGGQSGNPGSPFYKSSIDEWVKGDYYPLHFLKNGDAENKAILAKQVFLPQAVTE